MLTINKKHEQAIKKYLKIKDAPWIHEEKLWLKVQKYQKIISSAPGVLCVCVWNSLAMNAAHKNSDIDLFIITSPKRIWTSRIYLTLLLTILRQRKTAKKHAGKFCLSFFITENHLDLSPIAIENDIYLSYWIKTLIPIVNKQETFERFQAMNSSGGKLEVNHAQKNIPKHQFLTQLWDKCEKLLQKIFLPRTKKSFQKLWKPFWVIISDDILKFHDTDRRKEIRDIIVRK